jgi:hypothetical protein
MNFNVTHCRVNHEFQGFMLKRTQHASRATRMTRMFAIVARAAQPLEKVSGEENSKLLSVELRRLPQKPQKAHAP